MNRFPAKRHNEPGGQRRPKHIAPDVQQEIMIIFSAPFFFLYHIMLPGGMQWPGPGISHFSPVCHCTFPLRGV
jgi:hypothetical protein